MVDSTPTEQLTVVLRPGQFTSGAYATVFFQPPGRATKLFKRQTLQKEEHIRCVFASEVDAYNIVSSVTELRSLTPEYFGPVKVADILDEQGRSIASQYLCDVAYQMAFVPGEFVKAGILPFNQYQQLATLFRRHGVKHVRDASVILDTRGSLLCVIDFAVREYELEVEE